MNRIDQSSSRGVAELWDQGSPERVDELRKAFVNDAGHLHEPALAPVVGEFLARLDRLREHPSPQLQPPPAPSLNAPNAMEAMKTLAEVGARMKTPPQNLDAPSQARLSRMADVIQHFVALKEELVRRADTHR